MEQPMEDSKVKPTLVVLAAGMGSRYGGLKQIDPVGPNGEFIIDYSVFDAKRAGFGKVVFIIRKDIEKDFREQIGSRYEGMIPVEYAYQDLDDLPGDFVRPEERAKPWGTGHAVWAARHVVKEPFAAINADDFYGADGFALLAQWLSGRENGSDDFSMCGFTLEKTLSDFGTVSRGICTRSADSLLSDVEEHTSIGRTEGEISGENSRGEKVSFTGEEIVSMNMWGFTPALFTHLERLFSAFLTERIGEEKSEFYLPFAVDELIKSDISRVDVLHSRDSWFGVTYREDKPRVMASLAALIAEGRYPSPLKD
ncbi:MAG: sugar phosphate nucleotidyltransferase [Spirochaetales bacterium]|nr:sugar phosphate nucleotidyltransferase [Spirochaetales bacterium]